VGRVASLVGIGIVGGASGVLIVAWLDGCTGGV
jgi:hypothetical protein